MQKILLIGFFLQGLLLHASNHVAEKNILLRMDQYGTIKINDLLPDLEKQFAYAFKNQDREQMHKILQQEKDAQDKGLLSKTDCLVDKKIKFYRKIPGSTIVRYESLLACVIKHFYWGPNKFDTIKLLLDYKAHINTQDCEGDTILHHYAKKQYDKELIFLIDNYSQVNLNITNNKGETPLLLVCQGANNNPDLFMKLLQAGANPTIADKNNHNVLHACARRITSNSASNFLLQDTRVRNKINAQDNCEKTAMHYAAEKGNLNFLKELCDAGARMDILDEYNQTPLFHAVIKKKPDIIKHLVNLGAATNTLDYAHKTVFDYADEECIAVIINEEESDIFPDSTQN